MAPTKTVTVTRLKTPSMSQPGARRPPAVVRKTVVTQQKQAPSQGKSKKKKKGKSGKGNRYLASLMNPFASIPAKIPDDQCGLSGYVTSTAHLRVQGTFLDNTQGTTHSFGVLMAPYPGCAYTYIHPTGNSNAYFSDTGSTGTTNYTYQVLNGLSLFGATGLGCKVRCVSMGMRVMYEGTELTRSGRIFAGQAGNTDMPRTAPTTGNRVSPISAITGTTSPTMNNIRSSLENVAESRIGDGTFVAKWQPSGVPAYQLYGSTTLGMSPEGVQAGTSYPDTLIQTSSGGAGCQSGQNFLVTMIENDTTSAASTLSNIYSLEMVWNWEVLPDDSSQIAYNLSTSPVDFMSLQNALNKLNLSGTGGYVRTGTTKNRF